MIQRNEQLPANMVGFMATGSVTEDDFKNVVIPQVGQLVEETGQLNYLLMLETDISNFTPGAWLQDALMGLQHLTKWRRAAIVSDSEGIIRFTDIFSKFMIGEFKGFHRHELGEAIAWVSESGT